MVLKKCLMRRIGYFKNKLFEYLKFRLISSRYQEIVTFSVRHIM